MDPSAPPPALVPFAENPMASWNAKRRILLAYIVNQFVSVTIERKQNAHKGMAFLLDTEEIVL